MNRFVVFRILILLMFVGMSARLWDLQVRQSGDLSAQAEGNTKQTVWERPLRGEILASDGKTRLAESLAAYTVAIRSNQLPKGLDERTAVFARLTDMLGMSASLVLSPTDELRYAPGLRPGLEALTGALPAQVLATPVFTWTLPVGTALQALELTRQFTDTLTLRTPVEQRLLTVGGPIYETIAITTTRSLDLALMIRENSAVLPGIAVQRDYQRFYPHSAEVQSLSHLLGYIREIDMCDVMRLNPAASYRGAYTARNLGDCGIEPERMLSGDAPLRYLLNDRIGKDGLERVWENELRGSLGESTVEIDVHSRLVAAPEVVRPAEDGHNLVLTLDYGLQKRTEEIIRAWIGEAERRRQNPDPKQLTHRDYTPIEAGVAIVLEVNTGRVLAMVSWPSFDNNIFNRRLTDADVKRIFDPGWPHPAPAINQAIAGEFPPGSTWKQISAAAALQGGSIRPNTTIHDPGALFVKNQYYEKDPAYDQRFPNSFGGDRGFINVRDALQFSSNVFFQSAIGGTRFVRNLPDADKIGGLDPTGELLAATARAFGFGAYTNIALPGEADGVVPSKSWLTTLPEGSVRRQQPWNIADMYNTAIGQGEVLVTPLQLTLASAAIANGGTLYTPQLVRAITDDAGTVIREFTPEVRNQVPLSAASVQAIHDGMRLSVSNGFNTCARADMSGLQIAGKTGTAEYIEMVNPRLPTALRYEPGNFRKRSHAWFVGFAPYNDPQIQVLTIVEGAGDMTDGSATITVPATTEIMQAYFGVTPAPESFEPVPPYDLPCHTVGVAVR